MHIAPLLLVTLASLGAHGFPTPDPSPFPGCWHPDGLFAKVKRASDAFAAVIRSTYGPEIRFSADAPCNTKRLLSELAHAAALTTRNPQEYYQALDLEKRFSIDAADVTSFQRKRWPWCFARWGECFKKRSVAPGPVSSSSSKEKRDCDTPGSACHLSKHAADAVLKSIRGEHGSAVVTSSSSPSLRPASAFPPWCVGQGFFCLRKRKAAPEPSPQPWCADQGFFCMVKRDASPVPDPRPWCMRRYATCWKAKRDLDTLELAARNVLAEN
ncbi:clock-controlled pheromone ccg-4 precursor [Moelleriella libera RCEF 2490]|uniref:Clock-controlled pheromone ccg-4 n=1 Tax=Moelleriella libera RCEF 2490 TaxID=1081109 RepID=A0A168AS41_9HYPO|nr:clock-controlled pheromone ccg-4 precursor [Moelleriella libera RCEF 2490]